jgi:hypothetical protein
VVSQSNKCEEEYFEQVLIYTDTNSISNNVNCF